MRRCGLIQGPWQELWSPAEPGWSSDARGSLAAVAAALDVLKPALRPLAGEFSRTPLGRRTRGEGERPRRCFSLRGRPSQSGRPAAGALELAGVEELPAALLADASPDLTWAELRSTVCRARLGQSDPELVVAGQRVPVQPGGWVVGPWGMSGPVSTPPIELHLVNWVDRVQLRWSARWSPWAHPGDPAARALEGCAAALRAAGWGAF